MRTQSYYPWFDWLRAICASVVVLHHNSALRVWPQAGNFAVVVFFALSGWLIGGILVDMRPGQLPRFYFNRAVRIWIPYYVALGLLLVVAVVRDPITAKWLEIVAYKVTFVYNLFGTRQLAEFVNAMPEKGTFSHAWSIHAEEQFYLLAPLLLVIGAKHLGRSPLVWAALAVVVLAFAPLYGAIVLGVLAATVAHRYGPVHRTELGRWVLAALLAAGVAGLALAPDLYDVIAPFPAIAIVLLLAIPGPQHLGGVLAGGMSYPLYLNHWIAIYVVKAVHTRFGPIPDLLRHSLVLALAIALACAMYWWIDRRVLARRGEWFTAARGRIVTAVAYAMVGAGIVLGLAL